MGFFSSITSALGGVVGGILGGPAGAVAGATLAGGTSGALLDKATGSKSPQEKAYADQMNLTQAQFNYQKELHKNQIQWRVEDAKKAGLHPLAALGLSSASYSPVSTPSYPDSPTGFDTGLEFGQEINRAIQQGKTQKEREQAFAMQEKLFDIELKKANAEADLAETTAISERLRLQRELFPPSPVANQASDPQLPKEPQVYNAIDWAQNGSYYVPTLSEDAADRTDDDPWAKRVLQGGTLVEYIDSHPDSRPPAEKLSPADRKRLASGHFHWVVHPFGLRLQVIPGHEKFVKWRNKDGSVGGKLYF